MARFAYLAIDVAVAIACFAVRPTMCLRHTVVRGYLFTAGYMLALTGCLAWKYVRFP